jgi:hypothetical protein
MSDVENVENEKFAGFSSNPLDAIRKFCIECSGGHTVKSCPSDGTTDPMCQLFPFRLGKNPLRKTKVFSEEQKKSMADRLAAKRNV